MAAVTDQMHYSPSMTPPLPFDYILYEDIMETIMLQESDSASVQPPSIEETVAASS